MVADRAYLKGARIGAALGRLDGEVARIVGVLGSTGAMRVEPAALQPADVLLDLYGEDIRARAFVTRDEGAEMMLRPDFTVPIVRLHMDAGAEPARYVYCGPVWRRQEFGSDRPREYLQAGFEVFEGGDAAAHDAEVLALIVEALGDAPVDLVTGDLGLVLAAIDALDTSAARKAALRRHVWRPARFHALLQRFGEGHGAARAARTELLAVAAAGGTDALVAAAGVSVGKRQAGEVSARVGRLAEEAATPPLAPSDVARIEAVLAVEGAAPEALRRPAAAGARGGWSRRGGRSLCSAAGGDRGTRHRAGATALRGELRAHQPRVLRRLRVRGVAAWPVRSAADRQRRALRRTDPRAGAGAGDPRGRRHRAARGAGGAMRLKLGVPSKGRLQEETIGWFASRGVTLAKAGAGREYRGTVKGVDGVEVVLLAAAEIPGELAAGRLHLGVTGQDLVREQIPRWGERLAEVAAMGFGFADLVVAVPAFWIDVDDLSDLDLAAGEFRARHGHRLRVATRYHHLTREFFRAHGVADYQLVDSQGATEGAVKNLTAEAVADITTSGATLRDNHLRVLSDGLILRSQATLFAARGARWDGGPEAAFAALCARAGLPPPASPFQRVAAK